MAIARAHRTWWIAAGVLSLLPGALVSALQASVAPECQSIVPPVARSSAACRGPSVSFPGATPEQFDAAPCEGCAHYLVDPPGASRPRPVEFRIAGLRPECKYDLLHGGEFVTTPNGLTTADLRLAGDDPQLRCEGALGELRCALRVAPLRTRAVFLTGSLGGGPRELAADPVVFSAWHALSSGVLLIDWLRVLGLLAAAAAGCALQFARAPTMPRRVGLVGVGIGVSAMWALPKAFGGRDEAGLLALTVALLAGCTTAAALARLRRVYRRGAGMAALATFVAASLGASLGVCLRQLAAAPSLLPARHDLLLQLHVLVFACICAGLLVLHPGEHDARTRDWLGQRFPQLPLSCTLGLACLLTVVFALPVASLWGMSKLGACPVQYYSGVYQPSGLWSSFLLLTPAVLGLSVVAGSRRAVRVSTDDGWHETPFLIVEVDRARRVIRGRVRMRVSRIPRKPHERMLVQVEHNGAAAADWLARDTESILGGLARVYDPDALVGSVEVRYEYDGQGDFVGRSYRLPLILLFLQVREPVSFPPFLATGNVDVESGRLLDVERVADKLVGLRPGEVLLCPPNSRAAAQPGVSCFRLADGDSVPAVARLVATNCSGGGRMAIEVETIELAVLFLRSYRAHRRESS